MAWFDPLRYWIAVLLVVAMPPAVIWWFLIHPFAAYWRRLGARWTMAIMSVVLFGTMALLFPWRGVLVGHDLGRHPAAWLGVASLVLAAGIQSVRRRHLSMSTLAGVPEVSREDKGVLLTEGIYAKVRNPRYLEVGFAVLGYALIANYTGGYWLFALMLVGLQVVVLLEERELRDRFGAEYEAYCGRTPRWLPRFAAQAPHSPRDESER